MFGHFFQAELPSAGTTDSLGGIKMSPYQEGKKPKKYSDKSFSYATYPRQLDNYKWWKPLLVLLVAVAIYYTATILLVLVCLLISGNETRDLLSALSGGYDGMNVYTPVGAIMSLGGVCLMLPSLMIAVAIFKERPFRTYSSTKGGFRFGIFFKCFLIGLVVVALPMVLITIFLDRDPAGTNQFTVAGFIICTILVPLQCAAEEYFFRGFIMQTVSSWTRLPIIGILVSVAAFAAMHPYNIIGVISVAVMGLILCVIAQLTYGLEASVALHALNNLTAFYLAGLGFSKIQNEVKLSDLFVSLGVMVLYLVVMIICKKKHMFDVEKKSKKAAA